MRELIAFLSVLMIVFLICLGVYLPKDKKETIKIVTIVNNEVLLNKSFKTVSCEYPPCYKYYANFSNHSVLISKDTYNRINEGDKVKLTVIDKNPSWISWLIMVSIFLFAFIIIGCVTTQKKYESGGEYYG